LHDVASFRSGVQACDDDLFRQARKPVPTFYVWAERTRIIGFCRYKVLQTGSEVTRFPCFFMEFLARDLSAPGAGVELMLRSFVVMAKDGRSRGMKGLMIDSLNCGNPAACAKRWHFFTTKFGFSSISPDGAQFGYAFMPMSTVLEIADRWSNLGQAATRSH
jgi:hypothetical protein